MHLDTCERICWSLPTCCKAHLRKIEIIFERFLNDSINQGGSSRKPLEGINHDKEFLANLLVMDTIMVFPLYFYLSFVE